MNHFTYLIFKLLKISFLLYLAISNLSCSGEIEPQTLTPSKKIIKLERQTVLPPPNFDTTLLKTIIKYNQQGNPIEESEYSKFDGSVIIHTTWTYDEFGNVTSKITDNKDVNRIFKENFKYEYGAQGRKVRMIEQNHTNSDKLIHTYSYHNQDGYTDTITIRNEVLSILEYNNDDKIIRGRNFQQRSRVENQIDEYGNYTQRKQVFEDGPPNEFNYKNEYDQQGNLVRRILDHRYREYEYNENGDVIKETRLESGNPILIIHYKYEYF